MRKVERTSLEAYHRLKESGVLSELQEKAFLTVRKFHQEHGYWPTTREAHAFLAIEKQDINAQLKGPEYIRRRLSELVEDSEDNNPDLLEKLEPREQKYLKEKAPEAATNAEAHPLRIIAEPDKEFG